MADVRLVAPFARLVDIMARLRAPGGCPWDREQTPQSLRPYVLEEAYEVLEAIEQGDPTALCEELGDLLLQVVFQAELAAEAGTFTIADVATAISDKLERRHPHVFGDARADTADEVARNWRRLKAVERTPSDTSIVDGVPGALPALARAQKVGDRIAHAGFDWPNLPAVLAKVHEELHELEDAVRTDRGAHAVAELGDLLLTATSVARHLGTSAELALREATDRLGQRMRAVEAAAGREGRVLSDLSAADRDRLWDAAKADCAPR